MMLISKSFKLNPLLHEFFFFRKIENLFHPPLHLYPGFVRNLSSVSSNKVNKVFPIKLKTLRIYRTVLLGFGFLDGDWKTDHDRNKKLLYIIEPVVESLVQVKESFESDNVTEQGKSEK